MSFLIAVPELVEAAADDLSGIQAALGLAPTGNRIGMRVMDFWRRDADRLVENWVFIDIPDLLLQMGVDVFARAAELAPVPIRR